MHDYRAIFLDIDGTLTQPGHSAPPVSAVAAIESAAWDAAFSSALAAVKRCSSRFFIGNGGEAAKQSADAVCQSVEAGGLAKAFADFGLLA